MFFISDEQTFEAAVESVLSQLSEETRQAKISPSILTKRGYSEEEIQKFCRTIACIPTQSYTVEYMIRKINDDFWLINPFYEYVKDLEELTRFSLWICLKIY